MRPIVTASATRLFAKAVLTPTKAPVAVSTNSQLRGCLRLGLPESDSQTRLPGAAQPVMAPVLGVCAVTRAPLSKRMSAKNRL